MDAVALDRCNPIYADIGMLATLVQKYRLRIRKPNLFRNVGKTGYLTVVTSCETCLLSIWRCVQIADKGRSIEMLGEIALHDRSRVPRATQPMRAEGVALKPHLSMNITTKVSVPSTDC